MIEVKNVTKIYNKKNAFTALDNINLTIPSNTSVAILGKSGSGKSTLMHAISGLDKPQKGQVLVDGEDILRLKPRATDRFRASKMAFIFQSFFVEGGESCYNNISLSLETAGVPVRKRKKLIEQALQSVDLGDKIKSRAKDLSGGQKQRLAIARAIVGEPEILFADEPTGNLDSVTSKVIENLLFDYQKKNRATLIIVTHDEELASRCNTVINIKDGKIVSQSTEESKK
jgi:predicted ABC transporter, ATPase component